MLIGSYEGVIGVLWDFYEGVVGALGMPGSGFNKNTCTLQCRTGSSLHAYYVYGA